MQEIQGLLTRSSPEWAAQGVRFALDATATPDAELGDEAIPGSAHCDSESVRDAGKKYQGFVPFFVCSSSVRAGGESSFTDNAAYAGTGQLALASHELGHYFGLRHTFVEEREFNETFIPVVAQKLNGIPPAKRKDVYKKFVNGDAVTNGWFHNPEAFADTAGSLQNGVRGDLLDPPAPIGANECRASYTGKLPVPLSDGTTFIAQFTPDRTNPMTYFGFCNGVVPGQYQFSAKQGEQIRKSLASTRLHLQGPGLEWTSSWGQVPGATGKPVASTTFAGRLYLFAAGNGADQKIYANSALPRQAFGDWGTVGGATDSGLGATQFDSKLYAFAKGVGADHNIYFNVALPNQPFIGWNTVGGKTDKAIAATTFDNRLYLAAKGDGADHRIYVNSALAQQPFGGWIEVGGATDEALASTVFDGKLYLFAKGDGSTNYFVNAASPGQPFTGWSLIPSALKADVTPNVTARGALAAASYSGRLYILARGSDDRVYINSALPQQAFGSWVEVPGDMTTDVPPTAVVFDNRLYVVIKTSDNRVFAASAAAI